MSWNYRVVCHRHQVEGKEEVSYSIHEVYYDSNGTATAYSENPISLWSNVYDDLRWDLTELQKALEKPTLEASSFATE